jgi:O-antigen/teichoic acid export membrane protein
MTKVRRALKFSIITTHLENILSLIGIVIVARLLTPDELGLFAIAGSLVIIANSLRTFGVGNYIVKKETLKSSDIKSALGLNIIVSISLGVIIALSAYPLELFYEKNDLSLLILILSVPFFVSAYSANGIALLTRDFKFDAIFKIGIATQLSGLVITIILVYLGFSYFALAIASALQSIINVIMISLLSPSTMEWVPRFKGLKRIAKFGFYVTVSNLCLRLNLIFPDLIIGKMGTPSMVAYYSRGLGLINYLHTALAQGIMQVALPYFTENKKHGMSVEGSYIKATTLINGLLLPAFVVASVISEPLVLFAFGDQWDASTQLVALLCFWAFFNNMHPLISTLLIAEGHEKLLFYINLTFAFITAFVIVISFPYGLSMIAKCMIGVSFVYFVTVTILLNMYLNFSIKNFLQSQIKNVLICIGCYFVSLPVTQHNMYSESVNSIKLLLLLLASGITWMSLLFALKHPLSIEIYKIIGKSNK